MMLTLQNEAEHQLVLCERVLILPPFPRLLAEFHQAQQDIPPVVSRHSQE